MAPRGPAKHCGIVAEKDGAFTLIHARQNKRVSEEIFSVLWRRKLAFVLRLSLAASDRAGRIEHQIFRKA
jgi:hypothetical protein